MTPNRITWLAKGFRPFFLLSGVFGALVAPLWMLVFTGRTAPAGPLQGILWHAHEMVYGFTLGVVAGFLLTAVTNWTGRETAVGPSLGLLALVWTAARLLLLLVPGWAGAVVDLLFVPLVALAIARPLLATGRRRNYPFVVLLGLLWATDLVVWADVAGYATGWALPAMRAAVMLVAVVILMITGRVVPMFTRNATGAQGIRNLVPADVVALAATASLVPLELLGAPSWSPALYVVAGLAVFVRMTPWGTRHALRQPLLWVLHLGHASVGLGLVLRGLAPWWGLTPSAALHAVTVGGIGLLTLGMMSRVALGHTGRPIRVGPVVAGTFVALALAVVARVVVPWWWPEATLDGLWAAALLWAAGFAVYSALYLPVLVAPRVDGRPG